MEMDSVANLDTLDIVGLVLVGVASLFGAALGLGGGSLYIPILLLLMGYTPHQSTALSQCMMAGATLATFTLNVQSRHPIADRPLLNLDLVLMMAPFQLAGTVLGVIINRLTPAYAIVALMFVVMVLSNTNTYRKGRRLLKAEQLDKQKANSVPKADAVIEPEKIGVEVVAETKEGAEVLDSNNKPDGKTSTDAPRGSPDSPVGNVEDEMDNKLKISKSGCRNPFDQIVSKRSKADFIEAERKFSIMKWILLVALWSINFVFSFFRGSGEGTINLIEACSLEYWLMIFFSVFSLMLFGFLWFGFLVADSNWRSLVRYAYIKGDVTFNVRAVSVLAFGAFIAGVYGGLAGVGGSVILTPTLLFFNALPQVVVSVNATLILISSSAAATIYVTGGVVPIDMAALMLVICFVFSLFGTYYLFKWVKSRNAPSTLLFFYVIVLSISISTIAGSTIYKTVIGETDEPGVALLCQYETELELL